MRRFPSNDDEKGEPAESKVVDLYGSRRRMLGIPVLVGLVLIVICAAYLRPAYSADGPGVEESSTEDPGIIWRYPSDDKSLLRTTKRTAGDLLTNGDMDQMGFYWRYPNHYIAGAWFEWFSTRLTIPEFDDGSRRSFYHTSPGSQRLQLWARTYAGGLMQSVVVTPCTYLQFEAYGHSRPSSSPPPPVPVQSHMKVGIEPYGWMSGRTIPDYDPGLEPEEFPASVVWSPEATHDFVWSPYSVVAESQSNVVTVILYSNPEVDPNGGVWWNDTLWDTASLVEVPPPSGTILDGGQVPQPDGLIINVRATAQPSVTTVEWDTSFAASTQLIYRVLQDSVQIQGTVPVTSTIYMPRTAGSIHPSALKSYSPVDTTPALHHRVEITGLPTSYLIDFVALSRRLDGQNCVTSASSVTRAGSSESQALPSPVLP